MNRAAQSDVLGSRLLYAVSDGELRAHYEYVVGSFCRREDLHERVITRVAEALNHAASVFLHLHKKKVARDWTDVFGNIKDEAHLCADALQELALPHIFNKPPHMEPDGRWRHGWLCQPF